MPVLERVPSSFVPLTPTPSRAAEPTAIDGSNGSGPADVGWIDEIAAIIDTATASWRPAGLSLHERRWQRVAYGQPVAVRPLVQLGGAFRIDGETQLVAGRDLSLGGISFEHDTPLSHRYVALSFPLASNSARAVVTQLTWCRFTRAGHYFSGGLFVRAIDATEFEGESPAEQAGCPASRPEPRERTR